MGNTKRFAEAIKYLLKAPIFDATTSEPSVADDFELVIIGMPAIGLGLTPEVSSFVKRLPKRKGNKGILFGTYAVKWWSAENFGEGIR